jgi:hypothetical protein
MAPLKTYNGSEVSVIIGTRPIKSLAESDAVKVERDTATFTDTVGIDGSVTRSKSSDRRGKITVKVQQTSTDNDYLSACALIDEKSAAGVMPIMIRDQNGTTLVFAEQAWIEKPADISFGKEAGEREWVFRCAKLDVFVGGN